MRVKLPLLSMVLMLLIAAGSANAQVKISGTAKCAKPEVQHSLNISGNSDQAFSISQSKCTWSQPWTIAGIKGNEGEVLQSSEIKGDTITWHAVYVDNMENGDRSTYDEHGSGTLKGGLLQSGEEKWTLVAGTGKLKGYKGTGTCRGSGAPDGSSSWQCEGTLTPPKK